MLSVSVSVSVKTDESWGKVYEVVLQTASTQSRTEAGNTSIRSSVTHQRNESKP